jgi:tRNA(Arg) A34 adenosine deaminase TadA
LLGAEEVAAKLRDAHAEITALQHAASSGLSPIEMVVTRTICPPCARAIAAAGGTLTSPTSAVWPR